MTTRTEVRRAFYEQRPREVRMTAAASEMTSGEAGGLRLTGYASVTGAPYEVNDWLGTYTETIARGAFAKALQENDDVRLLINHDGVPLARTKSGTLALREVTDPLLDPQGRGQTGLWVETNLDPASPLVQTVRSAMDRGDLAEMSFAFQVTKQEWDGDYTQRLVLETKLFDTSVVTYPASPTTSAQLNSARMAAVAGRLREGRALDPEDVNVLTQALGWLSAIDSIVDQAQDVLADYMGVVNPDDDDVAPDAGEPVGDMMPDRSRALALTLARARA